MTVGGVRAKQSYRDGSVCALVDGSMMQSVLFRSERREKVVGGFVGDVLCALNWRRS